MRRTGRLFALIALLVLVSASWRIAQAQAEPTTAINTAFADLSAALGTPVTRANADTWTWLQFNYPDTSLGCPQAGQTYAQQVTPGYQITIVDAGVTYDYRASADQGKVFRCTNPVAVTSVPVGTASSTDTAGVALTPGSTDNGTVAPPQPTTYQNPMAYVGPDGNVYITTPGGGAGIAITNDANGKQTQTIPFVSYDHVYGQFRWSPDGTKLLYSDSAKNTMYLVLSGQKPIQVASGLAALYPGVWSQDGTEFAYAVETGQASGDNGRVRQIQALPVTATGIGSARVAGSFVQSVGCGGGGADPADNIYMMEAGYQGNGLMLAWIPQGFVYSTTCNGVGLALANTTGQVLWNVGNLSRAAISPDLTKAVAIQNGNDQQTTIAIVDLATGNLTQVPSSEPNADQLAWTTDGGSILYSTVNPGTTISAGNSDAVKQVFGSNALDAKSYTVNFWQTPASGGASLPLIDAPLNGRGIGVIAPASDGSGVAISFVTSLVPMLQQLNNNAPLTQALSVVPRSQVFFVQTGSTQPILISYGGRPAFAKGSFVVFPANLTVVGSGGISGPTATLAPAGPTPTVAPTVAGATTVGQTTVGTTAVPPTLLPSTAIPPTAAAGSATGPALVVGGHAVVTLKAGETLNLRQSPSKTAAIVSVLQPGTVLNVVSGPQSAEGLRWWQVSLTTGSASGWVVDAVTNADGSVETTLAPQ